MAKHKSMSEKPLASVYDDWYEDGDGKAYRGQYIKERIQDKFREIDDGKMSTVYFDTVNMRMLSFNSVEDREAYLETGDASAAIDSQAVEFTGLLRKMSVVNLQSSADVYFTTTADKAIVRAGFTSQEKPITDPQWSDVMEDALFTLAVDAGTTGNYRTIVSDVFVPYGEAFEFDLKRYLEVGTSRVRISATGVTSGQTGVLALSATLTTMYLQEYNLAWAVPFVEGAPFTLGGFKIGGAISKRMLVRMTGAGGESTLTEIPLGTSIYVNNAYHYGGLPFPAGGTGVYDMDVWLDADGLESDHLRFPLMCVSAADVSTARLVCVNNAAASAVNYGEGRMFDFATYNGGRSTASPSIRLTFEEAGVVSVVREETLADARAMEAVSYTSALEIVTESLDLSVEAEVEFGNTARVSIPLDNTAAFPPVGGAVFVMSAAGRSNAQQNRLKAVNEADGTELDMVCERMGWVDGFDGWTADDTGRRCLLVTAGSRVEIPYAPLGSVGNGKTIEMTYRVRNASSAAANAITICDDAESGLFRGVRVRPNEILVHSRTLNKADSLQSYQPREGEVVNVQITIVRNYKVSYGNLVRIFVNGAIKREFEFQNNDSFVVPGNIVIGSDSADVMLYSMRVYDASFSSADAVRNYISSLRTAEEKWAAHDKINSVVDDSYAVDYDRARRAANCVVIELLPGYELPRYGLDKKYKSYCNYWVSWAEHPEWNFSVSGEQFGGQGTSSMNYWRWNLRFRHDKSPDAVVTYADGTTQTGGSIMFRGDGDTPINNITAKTNYASSMQSHKMGLTGMFNDLHHEIGLDNEAGGRVAVWQEPFYFFVRSRVEGTADQYRHEFIGLFTMGPDKGDKATFGYDRSEFKSTLIHMEGTDHSVKGVGMEYPWEGMAVTQNADGDFFVSCDKGMNTYDDAFEVGAVCGKKTLAEAAAAIEAEFAPAYRVVYDNSTNIMGTSTPISEINADPSAWGLLKDADGHAYQRFEVWVDGDYDLYYLSRETGLYEPNGVNLLSDLGLTAADVDGMTISEKNGLFKERRRARFKAAAGQFWHINDALFCKCFLELTGCTDNFKKNSYPYKFAPLADGGRWRWRQDDLDTSADIDNQGLPEKGYSIEMKDFADDSRTAYVFKGEDSVFWTLMHECFADEERVMGRRVMDAMSALSGKSGNSMERLLGFLERYMWDKAQNYFPKSAYNADAEYKYEDAWPQFNSGNYSVDVNPLAQSLGDHFEAEVSWFEKRLIYMMSKWGYGPFASYNDTSLGVISFRTQLAQSFTLTPSLDMYPAILTGQGSAQSAGRTLAGEAARIDGAGGTNTNVYIMASDYMTSLGDLSTLSVDASSNAGLSVSGKRLLEIKVGDADASKVTSNLQGLNVGDCPSLVRIDARNLASLTGDVSLAGCPHLREAWFGGTDVRNLELPDGAMIETLQLSPSMATLTMLNLKRLATLDYESLSGVEYLRVEGCPQFDVFAVLKEIFYSDGSNLTSVRLTGVDYEGDTSDLSVLAALANGLDKDGNPHPYNGIGVDGTATAGIPVLEGRMTLTGNVYEDEFEAVAAAFPNLDLTFEGEFYVRFRDKASQDLAVARWGGGKAGVTWSDLDGVADIAGVFSSLPVFRDLDKFRNLTTLSYAFNNGAIEEFDGSGADTSAVTSMEFTFRWLNSVSNLDVSGWDVSSVTNMRFMFGGCSSLVELDVSGWDVSSVTTMWGMFGGCSSLVELDVSGWDVSSVTSMWGMFDGCSSLVELDVSGWDVSSVTSMWGMFDGCSSLSEIDVSGWDFSNVTSMADAFHGVGGDRADKETPMPMVLSGKTMTNATTLSGVFGNSGFTSININGLDARNATTFADAARESAELVTFTARGARLDKVTSMASLLYNCKKLVSADFHGAVTASLQNADWLFESCESLTVGGIDLTGVDFTKVTSGQGMFKNCKSLTSVPIEVMSLTALTNANQMFYGCSALTEIDLSECGLTALTNANRMFYGCSALTEIDLSECGLTALTNANQMFRGCANLVTLNLGTFDFSCLNGLSSSTSPFENDINNKATPRSITGTFTNIMSWVHNIDHWNLTRESVLCFFNGLYDYAGAGDTDTHEWRVNAATYDLLTAADLAIAVNKGWTIIRNV